MNDNSYKKRVTIIVPSFNHKRFIIECLDGIYSQTFKDYEWIVIDDGSRDGSAEMLSKLQPKYGYKLFLQDNKGLSATLTETLQNHVSCEYVAYCASDDIWLPNKLELQVRYMDEHPDCAMCYGKAYKINDKSVIVGEMDSSNYKDGYIFDDILKLKFDPPVNIMFRRQILQEVGYYPVGVIAEDYYMNCKISYKYKVGYIPIFLLKYRIAELGTKRDPKRLMESVEKTMRMYSDESGFEEAIHLHFLRCFYVYSWYIKYKLKALKYMLLSLRYFNHPLFIKGIVHLFFRWLSFVK